MGKGLSIGVDAISKIGEARRLMTAALALLDETCAPADIGAHLDAAICRLIATLEHGDTAREDFSGIGALPVLS